MTDHPYRSATCGEIRPAHAGQPVRLSGWCHRIRDHGGVLFIDLRDHYGITQVVVNPQSSAFAVAETLRDEWVIRIDGTVRIRPDDTTNPDMATGEVEVGVAEIEVLGSAEPLPMPVFESKGQETDYPEEIRFKYRFLDLRRTRPHANIVLRSQVIRFLRQRMEAEGFMEFQTPILTASSPEGARDFLVPSRLHPGEFYALPQAPQQFKQLIMTAGFDRYFQIAPCFRDEAARSDRSPGEFYQLDIEMAFATQEDVFGIVEPMVLDLYDQFAAGRTVHRRVERIPYNVSMLHYGNDKPDLRNPLVIHDAGPAMAADDMTLAAFKGQTARMIRVRAEDVAGKSRKWFKDMEGWAVSQGAKGLGYLTANAVFKDEIDAGEPRWTGPLAKFFGDAASNAVVDPYDSDRPVAKGDIVFFAVGKEAETIRFSGLLRTKLAEELDLIDRNAFRFAWIVDYPMFERNEETGQIDFSHNPFSMPQGGLEALEGDPLTVKAYQYDFVCNGIELSSGAIRNHRPDIMERAFALAGYDRATLEEKFGGMLSAFRLGAPPHGGIAPGIDRMVMMLAGEENLREVVLFPLNQQGRDLMMGAPSPVTEAQWKELRLRKV